MISMYQYLMRKMKENFTDFDYGLLKLYGALFGLVVGAFFPEIIKDNLFLIVGVFLLLLSRYIFLLFIKGDRSNEVIDA